MITFTMASGEIQEYEADGVDMSGEGFYAVLKGSKVIAKLPDDEVIHFTYRQSTRPDNLIEVMQSVDFAEWFLKFSNWINETATLAAEPIPSTPEEMTAVDRDLAGRVVFVGTLRAQAKSYLSDAIGRETERLLIEYKAKKIEVKPSLLQDIAAAKVSNEKRIYDTLERLGATTVHKLDSLRTEISMQKELLRTTK